MLVPWRICNVYLSASVLCTGRRILTISLIIHDKHLVAIGRWCMKFCLRMSAKCLRQIAWFPFAWFCFHDSSKVLLLKPACAQRRLVTVQKFVRNWTAGKERRQTRRTQQLVASSRVVALAWHSIAPICCDSLRWPHLHSSSLSLQEPQPYLYLRCPCGPSVT